MEFSGAPLYSLQDLQQISDLIVNGRVRSIASYWRAGLIYSEATIEVEESLKGRALRRVVVTTPGGTVGEVSLFVTDSLSFFPGERVRLFLKREPDGYRVLEKQLLPRLQASGVAPLAAPTLSGISPAKANAGIDSQVTLTGSGFGSTPGAVNFTQRWSYPPVIVSWSDTRIVATVPTFTYSGAVSITTAGGLESNGLTLEIGFGYLGFRWNYSQIPYRVNLSTLGVSGGLAAIEAAAQTLSAASGLSLVYSGDTSAVSPLWDGSSQMFWASGRESLATAYVWSVNYYIVEFDIQLNPAYPWSATGSSGAIDIQNIVTHELGHCLGLADLYGSLDSEKTMYGYAGYGETKKRSLEADDLAGLQYLYAGAPPPLLVADFTYSPQTGTAPLTVQFTDTSTGQIAGWGWQFGDGGVSTQQNPSHIYRAAGSYTVTLMVTGPGGPSYAQATINVGETAPQAAFSAVPTSGTVPLTVQFQDLSQGTITDWAWAFGDGGTSTQQNPSHIYQAAGSYTVTLTVTGPGGTSTPAQATIVVSQGPAPPPEPEPPPDTTLLLLLAGGGLALGAVLTPSLFKKKRLKGDYHVGKYL